MARLYVMKYYVVMVALQSFLALYLSCHSAVVNFDEENMTWTLARLERSSLGDSCCIRWTLGRATLGNSYRVRLSSHLIGQREL
jgi:hypothetical protein